MSDEPGALPPEWRPDQRWYELATDIGQVLHDTHGMPPQTSHKIEKLALALSGVDMQRWHSQARQTNSSVGPLKSLEAILTAASHLQKWANSQVPADIDARRRLALAWAGLQGKVWVEDYMTSWMYASDEHADWQVIRVMERISDAVKLAIGETEHFAGGSYSIDLATELSKIYADFYPINSAARLDFVNLASEVIAKKSFTRNSLNQALKRAR